MNQNNNGLKFIFERFFRLRDNQSKMGFKFAIYCTKKRQSYDIDFFYIPTIF